MGRVRQARMIEDGILERQPGHCSAKVLTRGCNIKLLHVTRSTFLPGRWLRKTAYPRAGMAKVEPKDRLLDVIFHRPPRCCRRAEVDSQTRWRGRQGVLVLAHTRRPQSIERAQGLQVTRRLGLDLTQFWTSGANQHWGGRNLRGMGIGKL